MVHEKSTHKKISAGIVCYMVADDCRTHIALGREQYVRGWRGSLKWSDFGGQSKRADGNDPAVTAAREFFEETLGVFGDPLDQLHQNQYNFQVMIKRSGRMHHCTKVLYVMQVPWDAQARYRFYGRREHLKHILFTVARIRQIQRRLSQRRLPVPDYPARVANRFMLVTNLLSLEQCTDDSYWITLEGCHSPGNNYFRCPGRTRAYQPCASRPAIESYSSSDSEEQQEENESDTEDAITVLTDAVVHQSTVCIPVDAVDDYAEIITLKNWLDELVSSFPTDVAARAITYKQYGSVRAWLPFVHKDFLEKDDLKLWKMDDLQSCTCKRSYRHASIMRCSFIVPLKLLLQQLSMSPNGGWRYHPCYQHDPKPPP